MKHSVPHDLGMEKAAAVAKAALESYAKRFAEYHPTTRWMGDRKAEIGFSTRGLSLTGSVEVTTTSIDLHLDVPFLLRPFKSKAIGVIEEAINHWIGKAKAGEL